MSSWKTPCILCIFRFNYRRLFRTGAQVQVRLTIYHKTNNLLVHSVFRIVLEAVTQSIQFQENIPPYLPSCGCLPVDPATKRPKLIHHCCVQPSQKASPNFINLRVSLPSGRCELVSLPLNDAGDDLKIAKKNVSSYVSWCLPHQTDTFWIQPKAFKTQGLKMVTQLVSLV